MSSASTPLSENGSQVSKTARMFNIDVDTETNGLLTAPNHSTNSQSHGAYETTAIRITEKSRSQSENGSKPHPGFYASRQPVDGYQSHLHSDLEDFTELKYAQASSESAEARDRRLKAM